VNEWITNLNSSFRREDLLDIAIVAFIIYRALNLIRGTRAVRMLTGLAILAVGYFFSQAFELYTTQFVLSAFFDYFVFIAIVLFQDDLRRALTTMGRNPFSVSTERESRIEMAEEVSRAAAQLARDRIGALIVIEREEGLKNFIDTGSKLEAKVRTELLYSIFIPTSPLHDGAVIINGDRIAAAGCFLPLSKDPEIDKKYGTRHRAAIGITEDTDAVVVLVSEEAGAAHLVHSGRLMMNLSETQIREGLIAILALETRRPNISRRILDWIEDARPKSGNS